MMKTLIAGVAALSLTLTSTPVHAQNTDNGFQHEDVATALFGLLVLGIAASALSRDHDRPDAHEPPVVRHSPGRIAPDRGGLRNDTDTRWHVRPDRGRNITVTTHPRLPSGCMRVVNTRFGDHRILGRNCLRENYRAFNRLPAKCQVRVIGDAGVRNGFDPACLHSEGFRGHR